MRLVVDLFNFPQIPSNRKECVIKGSQIVARLGAITHNSTFLITKNAVPPKWEDCHPMKPPAVLLVERMSFTHSYACLFMHSVFDI